LIPIRLLTDFYLSLLIYLAAAPLTVLFVTVLFVTGDWVQNDLPHIHDGRPWLGLWFDRDGVTSWTTEVEGTDAAWDEVLEAASFLHGHGDCLVGDRPVDLSSTATVATTLMDF